MGCTWVICVALVVEVDAVGVFLASIIVGVAIKTFFPVPVAEAVQGLVLAVVAAYRKVGRGVPFIWLSKCRRATALRSAIK